MGPAVVTKALNVLSGGAVFATAVGFAARLWDMNGGLICTGETGERFVSAYWLVYVSYLSSLGLLIAVVAGVAVVRPAWVDERAILALVLCCALLRLVNGYLGPCP